MGKFSMKSWVSAKPVKNKGEQFTDGRGIVIVKDVRVDDTRLDTNTYILELLVKVSTAVRPDVKPNAPGATISVVQALTDDEFGYHQRDAKDANLAILGPDIDVDDNDALGAAFAELMRLDDDGRTKKGTECPVRGVEIAYETYRKKSSDNVYVKFSHIPLDEKVVLANRAVLDGKEAA